MTANQQAAISAWSDALGAEFVLHSEAAQIAYGSDTGDAKRRIVAALLISDAAQLKTVLKISQQHRLAVYPISTGHNWGYGTALPPRDDCVIIDLSRLQSIIDFDAELGVVTLEPGVTQGMLAEYLAKGQHDFLVPVTGAGPSCSLMANALERGYGVTPYVDHFGAVTDIEGVLPDGSPYRTALREAGGEALARLFKWGIGPYSVGLFTQSGFGIVTRMSITLMRRPECVKVCLFSLKEEHLLEPAVLGVRSIMSKLHGIVGAVNLMNRHRVLSMTAPLPRAQLGADGLLPRDVIEAMGREFQIFPWTGFISLYGTQRVVAAAQKEIKDALRGVASRMLFLTPKRARQLSQLTRIVPGKLGSGLAGMTATLAKSLELVAGTPNETALPLAYWRNQRPALNTPRNPGADGCGLIWYAPLVPMRPTEVRAYVDMIHDIAPRHGIEPLITFTALSDKLFDSTVPLLFDRDQPGAAAAAQACFIDLLLQGRANGWFPYRIGVDAMPLLADMQTASSAFHDRLRQALDPHDLMAPGRYR